MKRIYVILIVLIMGISVFSKIYIDNNMVVFEYKDITASAVYLAGSFNNWNSSALLMKKVNNGVWRIAIKLSPGEYQYKFVINGSDWKEDPEAPGYVPDGFGGKNGVFTLVLENGTLKIKKAEKETNNILSGGYKFSLNSKIDKDTFSLKTPEINHEFILTINPDKGNMKFEANLYADNTNWQFKLKSLKINWENEKYLFGIYNNAASNNLWNFYEENIEKTNIGFYGGIKTSVLDITLDIYSKNNNIQYMLLSKTSMEDINGYFGYIPATDDSSMNIYARVKYLNIGIEGKYSDSLEYVKGDYENDDLYFEGMYEFDKKNVVLYSEILSLSNIYTEYNTSEKTYFVEVNLNIPVLSNLNGIGNLHYDNDGNIGYNAGIKLIEDENSVSITLGHKFDEGFKDYYFMFNASAEF